MKTKLNVLWLLLLPLFLQAQEQERRSEVVVIAPELNDQYRSLKNNLDGSNGQVRKLQETRVEIKERYPQTHDAPDLDLMLKDLDRQEQQVEENRKTWKQEITGVEVKIKDVILSAHGRAVIWRAYNANPVEKLGTVITTTYSLKDDHVVAVDAYYPLTETEKH
jgi:predicted nuclease with RNAse H fold